MLLLIVCLPLVLEAQQPHKANEPLKAQQPVDTVIERTYSFDQPVRSIHIRHNKLILKPQRARQLTIGGTYTAGAAVKFANTTPTLQDQYVSGESENGVLAWLRNDPLSYGPHVHSLQYAGPVYDNVILQKAGKLSESLYLKAGIQKNDWTKLWSFTLNTGQSSENLILPNNNNSANNLGATAERFLGDLSLSGGYHLFVSRFTNSNAYGYLNHLYENALLTPVNNPYSPPPAISHGERLTQHTGFLSLQQRGDHLNLALTSSIDAVNNKIDQELQRNQHETHYNTDANAVYTIRRSYPWMSAVKLHALYNNDDVSITYPKTAEKYHYSRTTGEGGLSFTTTYEYDYTNTGLTIGDKFYRSNTSSKNSFFLPELDAFVSQSDRHSNTAKLAVTYSAFYSEPSITRSWSPFLLTRLLPQQSMSFMPTTEVSNINGLPPVRHQELTSRLELTLLHWLTATADLSLRTSKDNPFPSFINNQLTLGDRADLRYRGLELTLAQNTYLWRNRRIKITNSISFWRYTNTVTNIAGGSDSLPIAGFSNIHNTLIKGQPLGVITGNTWLRNADHQLLLGDDGFPLADPRSKVIGNPTPDYTLKISHQISWNRLTLSVDWQYRKGGDVWNGTQAVLDYSGRSAGTGVQRSWTNYIFSGAMSNGNHGAVPVSFYDPSLPVQENRWVRYGYTGVAEAYIQKGDNIRISMLSLAYTIRLKQRQIRLLAYTENLMIWSAYKGADPQQRLFDQPDASGLDFFNLPSAKSYGFNASIQF